MRISSPHPLDPVGRLTYHGSRLQRRKSVAHARLLWIVARVRRLYKGPLAQRRSPPAPLRPGGVRRG